MAPMDFPLRTACSHGSTATEAFAHRAGRASKCNATRLRDDRTTGPPAIPALALGASRQSARSIRAAKQGARGAEAGGALEPWLPWIVHTARHAAMDPQRRRLSPPGRCVSEGATPRGSAVAEHVANPHSPRSRLGLPGNRHDRSAPRSREPGGRKPEEPWSHGPDGFPTPHDTQPWVHSDGGFRPPGAPDDQPGSTGGTSASGSGGRRSSRSRARGSVESSTRDTAITKPAAPSRQPPRTT